MTQQALGPNAAVHEGLVVWDQRGVVVRWPNGEASHFSWETLRQLSRCDACLQRLSPGEALVPPHIQASQSVTL
jgi:hypothetical protein